MIQDKLFTFGPGSYTGGGSVTPADVQVGVVFNILGGGQDLHGFVFAPIIDWSTSFTLSYTISVIPGNKVVIGATKLQQNAGFSPGAPSTTVTLTENGGALPTLQTDFNSAGNETSLSGYPSVTSISVVNSVTIPSKKILISLENDFHEDTITTPEPAVFYLCGGGLLAFSLLMRKHIRDGAKFNRSDPQRSVAKDWRCVKSGQQQGVPGKDC
jgi:hypothetical protein